MVQENINVVPTGPLIRARPRNAFDTVPVSHPLIQATEPIDAQATGSDTAGSLTPGTSWDVGKEGRFTPQRILVLPYGEGMPGSGFWMRIYGWIQTGLTATGTGPAQVWIPILLAQFVCRIGSMPGPSPLQGRSATLAMDQTENLCDVVRLLQGRVGQNGAVVSPGPGFAAYALVELIGVQKISFEFQAPENNPVGMNAWWARR